MCIYISVYDECVYIYRCMMNIYRYIMLSVYIYRYMLSVYISVYYVEYIYISLC